MAVLENDDLKGLCGRLGNLVVYRRLGKICVRMRPEGFKPTGAGQVAQQHRLASVNIFYKAVKAAGLTGYWKSAERPAGWTGYNLFVSRNLAAFSADGLLGAPEKVSLTEKTGLELPDALTLEKGAEGRFRLTWRNVTGYPGCGESDRLVVALMRGGRYFDVKLPGGKEGIACRKDGEVEFFLPENRKEYKHMYCFMCSEEGEAVSGSVYLGTL